MNRLSTRRDPLFIQCWLKKDEGDKCMHVEKDATKAFAVHCEDDSFGPVLRNVVCEECFTKAEKASAEVLCTCSDCRKAVRAEDTREWRWFDFYAAQGDEPLVLCLGCWEAPKHLERMAEDRNSERSEDEYHARVKAKYG